MRFVVLFSWSLIFFFAIRAALLGRIGADVRAFQLAYCVGFIGYVILMWLVIKRATSEAIGSWTWWLLGCFVIRILLLSVEPSDDLYRYVWEGRVQQAGFNPYVYAPADPAMSHLRDESWARINHPEYTAIYGPLAQMQFRILAATGSSQLFFKATHVLWDLMTIAVLAAILRRLGRPPHGAIIYGLCPLVLTAIGIEGHLDSLMLLCIALAVWAAIAHRLSLAAAMVGLAVATKITAIVLLPWFIVRCFIASPAGHTDEAKRQGLVARIFPACVTVAVVALCYVPYSTAGAGILSSAIRFSGAGEFMSMLGTLRVTQFDSHAVRLGAGVLLGVITCITAARTHSFHAYGVAVTGALLILMPVVHYWYLTWILVFTALRLRWRWIAAALAMIVYFDASLAQERSGQWLMPPYASVFVWTTFLLTWAAEACWSWCKRRHTPSSGYTEVA